MRITCPNCSTQYEVDENDISFTGQDVQCSECMTIWTQTRGGEATNPRMADDLAEETSSDDEIAEIPDEPDEAPEAEIVSDLNYPEEPEEAPVAFDYPDATELPEEEDAPAAEITEPDDDEADAPELDEIPETDEASDEDEVSEDELEPLETSETTDDDSDSEEDPIWKEIAALANEASEDLEDTSTSEPEYFPPDDIPPIQSTPVVPDEQEAAEKVANEQERPWEAAAEAEEEGFSDFVWSDPSSDDEPDEDVLTETDNSGSESSGKPQFTPLPDTSGEQLEKMDDDLIAAALNEQMAIEDALEDEPHPAERDIANVPVELGGPRRRTPNVEALKSSVRAKSVKLTKEEEKEKVPARRFRRGLSLILLIFVILLAVYVSKGQIVEYLPVAEPYLETYASYVDILRANAEVFAANVWELTLQGVDWVMAKING